MATDHVPDDPALTEALGRLRDLEAPPSHVLHRAFDIWQPRRAAGPGLLKRIQAVLSFDNAGAPALAFGMRSAQGGPRQLLFAADGHDVDLRLQATATGHFEVRGQVLGPDGTGTVLLTSQAGAGEWHTWATLDELGEFSFDAVPAGTYRIALLLADAEVELPSFVIGTAGSA